ncbi:Hypp2823 [Branchiostoma lanceolatum]|uniref:Hypp2823 protein n=1 Tax=Branchiostoma lanceolatum TaxID=7740 RepID=A0A8J9ZUV6_BRALA|nr:Hypp2823 [Branchiostoma lanceolatum]
MCCAEDGVGEDHLEWGHPGLNVRRGGRRIKWGGILAGVASSLQKLAVNGPLWRAAGQAGGRPEVQGHQAAGLSLCRESSDSLNDFSHGTVSSVADVQETSLTHPADETIEDNADESDASGTTVTYTVVEGATKKGRDMLAASLQARVSVQLRTKEREHVFEPASELVDEMLLQAGHHPGLPSQAALLCRVNRAKVKIRPEEQKDFEDLMNFQLDEHYLPEDFLQADVPVGVNRRRRRHLLLATQQQLDILGQSNTIRPTCIWTHVWEGEGGLPGHLQLLDALPDDIQVHECVVDYEDTLWRVIPQLLPTVRMKGCSFHWNKVVWWFTQQCGLQKPYMEEEWMHRFVSNWEGKEVTPGQLVAATYNALRCFFIGTVLHVKEDETVQFYKPSRETLTNLGEPEGVTP